MKETSLKTILLDEINSIDGWTAKSLFYQIGEREGFSYEYVGRALRALEEEGLIQVSYYKSKRNVDLARYARIGESKPAPQKPRFEERNGIMYLMTVN